MLLKQMPDDLVAAKNFIYDPSGYLFTQYSAEKESSDYGACTFSLNLTRIKFRIAGITPVKTGQFVTLWKRDEAGVTRPHNISEPVDYYVISCRKDHLFGQFVFSKEILARRGILSTPDAEGKRGFRVYPPWDVAMNKQAQNTQQWQSSFFLEIHSGKLVDMTCAKQLYQV